MLLLRPIVAVTIIPPSLLLLLPPLLLLPWQWWGGGSRCCCCLPLAGLRVACVPSCGCVACVACVPCMTAGATLVIAAAAVVRLMRVQGRDLLRYSARWQACGWRWEVERKTQAAAKECE